MICIQPLLHEKGMTMQILDGTSGIEAQQDQLPNEITKKSQAKKS